MAQTKKNTKEITPVEQLLSEAAQNETKTNKLTEQQAIEMINELWDDVSSKNAMLKLIRAKGYSIVMNRVFTIYNKMLVLKNKESKETTKEVPSEA